MLSGLEVIFNGKRGTEVVPANLLSAYQVSRNAEKVQEALSEIRDYAKEFIDNQAGNGLFPFPLSSAYTLKTSVHAQLKVDLALLLSYRFTGLEDYLLSAAKNFDWVIRKLLMPNGGLKWDIENDRDFFEIHQMLLLIAQKYLLDLSNRRYDYTRSAILAWKFLLDGNAGCIDMYVQNLRSTG